MNRRAYLASLTGGGCIGMAGCLGRISDSGDENGDAQQSLPDGLTVDGKHWVDRILVDGLRSSLEQERSTNPVHTVIADQRSGTDRIDDEHEQAVHFVEETESDQSYLIVAEAWSSSEQWIELDAIDREDSTHEVYLEWGADGETVDDFVPHSVALRVTDDHMDAPDDITVYMAEEPTEAIDVE